MIIATKTTIPKAIPSTIPTIISTTILTTIPTIKSTFIHTIISTKIPTIIPSSLITIVSKTSLPSTILLIDKCIYGAVITKNCVFDNMTNNDIIDKVKNEVLETYPQDGINIVIPSKDNYAFQLTSSSNEINNFYTQDLNNNQMSIFNLSNCETLLKSHYNISNNSSLIILKYEKITGIGSEKSIQYEIYNPNNYQKLDLTICKNNGIDISFPIDIEEEITLLYNNLKEEGYDLFDISNKFYFDICTPFTAENGADVLLQDRLYYFFSKIVNLTTCPSNCKYSTFSIDTKYLYCQCEVNNNYIDIENSELFLGKLLYDTSNYVLKYTSYKTLRCYKLVFNSKYFAKNAGSIIILIIILIDIGFIIFFSIKGLTPFKVDISKLFFEEQNIDNKLSPFIDINSKNKNKTKNNYKGILITKGKNPPKKLILRRMLLKSADNKGKQKIENKSIIITNDNKTEYDKKSYIDKDNKSININFNDNIILRDNIGKDNIMNKTGDIKFNNNKIVLNKINNDNNNKNIIINATGVKSFYTNMNIGNKNKVSLRKDLQKSEAKYYKPKKRNIKNEDKHSNKSTEEKPQKKVKFKDILESNVSMIEEIEPKKPKKETIILDDYELNHLEYLNALDLDKRKYCITYFSILKRDQLIINTFFAVNDHNLFYAKISKFLFILCTLMTINVFLFADKSIHKLFISGVKYYFNYQILQIILSIVITYLVEIFLSYLTMIDKYYYEIKSLPKKENNERIFKILKYVRLKLIIFYTTTLIIFIFYWYSVSAFCSVYPNTQKIYLIDCLLSFIFYLLIPFIIYALTTLFRIISLKNIDKKLSCLYKISQIIPIF